MLEVNVSNNEGHIFIANFILNTGVGSNETSAGESDITEAQSETLASIQVLRKFYFIIFVRHI